MPKLEYYISCHLVKKMLVVLKMKTIIWGKKMNVSWEKIVNLKKKIVTWKK